MEYGFLTDVLENGRRFRGFNVIDDYSREVLFIEIDYSLPSNRIIWVLYHLINKRDKSKGIRMDNGSEFIARITANWSLIHDVEFKYIQPGKPTQNTFVERFNGSYRRGVLNKYIFEDLEQVREQTQIWMDGYNHFRPHDALGKIPPIEYAEIKNNRFDNIRKLSSSN